ncbi:MAG: ureidoglycolate lyase [Gammaproteobacteria bacterium]|nr:ureidoglycolate lyase [Gammaproteobacteria bacterium]
MKFVRYGEKGKERPGVLDALDRIRDISHRVPDIGGSALAQLSRFDAAELNSFPLVEGKPRIGQCVGGVGKFICVGLNYADHAQESGLPLPTEPVIFMKAVSALTGPYDEVIIPPGSDKTDWEVELGVVIGKEIRYADQSTASEAIAGYCVVNDLSERGFQLERGGQWSKGKGCDTFGPIGPWLVTADEVRDPMNLKMWLDVDGHRYQNGSTSTMIFNPVYLVSYISQFMSLQPGDIVSTGTPPGVGLGQSPPVYLKAGQTMRVGIEKLGEQLQRTVAYHPPRPIA